jgi:putative intracellular protease/amidase
MQIAIPLFDRFTALDAIGPYEVLSRLPGARVDFVAFAPGTVRTDTRMLGIDVEKSLDDVPRPDVLVVPGGAGTRAVMHDERMLDWVRGVHEQSQYTTSVCTGALVLHGAGVLDGIEATTHWLYMDYLDHPVARRVVEQGKVITAAGVSAGIDMALHLAERSGCWRSCAAPRPRSTLRRVRSRQRTGTRPARRVPRCRRRPRRAAGPRSVDPCRARA